MGGRGITSLNGLTRATQTFTNFREGSRKMRRLSTNEQLALMTAQENRKRPTFWQSFWPFILSGLICGSVLVLVAEVILRWKMAG
jgi:hypothetical protein